MKKQWTTVLDFIQNGKVSSKYKIINVEGMNQVGDGGQLTLVRTGNVGTPSQSFLDTGNNTCIDKNGDVWEVQKGDIVYFNGSDDWFGNGFGSKDEGTYLFQNDSWDRVTLYDDVGYMGLWGIDVTKAYKGQAVQTQVSGTPTGQYFTALQDTTVDPVGDDVNWKVVISVGSLSKYTDIVFKASNGNSTVESMIDAFNLNPLMYTIGTIIKTGGTTWEYIDSTGPVTKENFRALNAVNVIDFGSKGVGFDNTAAIQSAIDSGYEVFIGRDIELNGRLDIPSDCSITLADGVTVLSDYQGSESDFESQFIGVFNLKGTIDGVGIALTSDFRLGDDSLSIADASSLSVGDFIKISQDEITTPVSDPEKLSRWASYVGEITEINGNNIEVDYSAAHSYFTKYNAKIRKVTPVKNSHIKGKFELKFVGSSTTSYLNAVRFTLTRDCSLEYIKTLGGSGRNVQVVDSFRNLTGTAISIDPVNVSAGHGYAISYGGSHDCEIERVTGRNTRHTFDVSTGSNDITVGTAKAIGAGNVLNGHGMNTRNIYCKNSIAINAGSNVGLGNYSYGGDQDWKVDYVYSRGTTSTSVSIQNGSQRLVCDTVNHEDCTSSVDIVKSVESKDLTIGTLIARGAGCQYLVTWDLYSEGLYIKEIQAHDLLGGQGVRLARGSKSVTVDKADFSRWNGNATFTVESDPNNVGYDCDLNIKGGHLKCVTGYSVSMAGSYPGSPDAPTGLSVRGTKVEGGSDGAVRFRGAERLFLLGNEIDGTLSIGNAFNKSVIVNNYGSSSTPSSTGANVLIDNNQLDYP